MKRASSAAPEAIPWLWRERFPHRRLSVLTGPPGLGKSQITAFLAATVTADKPWPDGSPCLVSGPVVILSAEDDTADTVVPRLIAAGADHDRVIIVEAVRAEPDNGNPTERCFDLSRDIDHLQKVCGDEKAVLVIVDPVSAYLGDGVDGHSNTDVRRVLAPLAALAAKCRTAVVAVTHDRKSGGSAGERTIGSIAFIAAPRAVWGCNA
jgi:putative DNA primase/helicase